MTKALGGFYPTPPDLIKQMLGGIDFRYVDSILEPSAGKGDLADALADKMRVSHTRGYHSEYVPDIDTIEINTDLQHVLKGNGHRVVHNDFLTYQTYKQYSLIAMNPPFSNGHKHLLKAIEIMQRGGAIVCILNADTIDNPYSYSRQNLVDLLEDYNADITRISGAFSDAERRTDVDIMLIKLVIPQAENKSVIVSELEKAAPIREVEQRQCDALAQNDYIKATVDQFRFETQAGIQLIRDYKAMTPYISKSMGGGSDAILKLTFNEHNGPEPTENEFLRKMRKKYWHALFLNPRFTEKFTSNLLDKCRADVDRLADYDFSEYNINSIRLELSQELMQATDDTIIALFDELTNQHSWYDETSKNRHYFDGWYTNKCWIINKKVILPLRLYGYIIKDYDFYDYKVRDKIADIDKTLRYLAGSRGEHRDVMQIIDEAREIGQTKNIQFDFFSITCYKKGTTHITFTDEDLLKKFNIYGCQKKRWLPPTYGRKKYVDMDNEEQAVIDSFEGRESYNETMFNTPYFLGGACLELSD